MKFNKPFKGVQTIILIFVWLLAACQSQAAQLQPVQSVDTPAASAPLPVGNPLSSPVPYPTRPSYGPGELVDYTAQTGDTLKAVAAHFNTKVEEILKANSFIPADATTLPPGMPMKIPIYYQPFWGDPYEIIPDSLFVDGPAQVGFNVADFINSRPGWLKTYSTYASDDNRTAAQAVELVARNYSVSPRLLLALLEYQSGALTQAEPPVSMDGAVLGIQLDKYQGTYLQMVWAANALNNGYYEWRTGQLKTLELANGRIEQIDPWQNAATASLHSFYAGQLDADAYGKAISPEGLASTYRKLFGDPWKNVQPHIPGSLVQPPLALPFQPGKVWAYTGGPHTGWGVGEPLAAIDFAPPSVVGGCTPSQEWATAMAAGVVTRSETGVVMLDLDGDGDERTGWDILYLHVGTDGRIPAGTKVKTGDIIGHPSCEGGRADGTHIHIARKYNGEWILAGGVLPYNLEGWIVSNGGVEYQGTMTRYGKIVIACQCSDQKTFVQTGITP